MLFVIGLYGAFCSDTHGRKVGELPEMGVVSLAFDTVKFHFGYIAAGIVWADITHVTKPTADVNIAVRHFLQCAVLTHNIQRYSINKVGGVCSLKQSEADTFSPL